LGREFGQYREQVTGGWKKFLIGKVHNLRKQSVNARKMKSWMMRRSERGGRADFWTGRSSLRYWSQTLNIRARKQGYVEMERGIQADIREVGCEDSNCSQLAEVSGSKKRGKFLS